MVNRLNDGGSGGSGSAAPVVRPAQPAAPYSPPSSGGGGYSGGGGGGGTSVGPYKAAPLSPTPTGGTVAPAPVSSQINPTTWLAGDKTYQDQLAALQAAAKNYTTDFNNQTSQYNTNYNDSLRRLGWSPSATAGGEGAWNFADQNTAAGRGYTNEANDFAGRGLIQSTLYKTALDDFQRSLNDQRNSMDTSKQAYGNNLATQLAAQQNQNLVQTQNARAEALMRLQNSFNGSTPAG